MLVRFPHALDEAVSDNEDDQLENQQRTGKDA
jgi:hypothetical protein